MIHCYAEVYVTPIQNVDRLTATCRYGMLDANWPDHLTTQIEDLAITHGPEDTIELTP